MSRGGYSLETIGAAVIGLHMGRAHAAAYARHPRVRLVGVCDLNETLANEVAAELGAEVAVTDYRRLLERPDVHCVSVATPDYFHEPQSVEAMEAGKHVLCEKPMAPSIQACRHIADTAEARGVQFMIGQTCRFYEGFRLGKQLVANGEIGELYFVESEYAHSYRHVPGVGNWRKDPVKLREPFLGGACHAVDVLRWVAGDIVVASAYSNRKCLTDWPVDDCTIACFKMENGIVGKVLCAIGCVRPYTMRSVFWGTEGTVICDNHSPTVQLCSTRLMLDGRPDFVTIPVQQATAKPMDAEIGEFVDCLLNNRRVEMDAWQGGRTAAACLAAIESAKTGDPVAVNNALEV